MAPRFALMKKPEPEAPEPLAVPRLEEVDPEFAALLARRVVLERKRIELSAEYERVYQQCVDITQAEFERNARASVLLDGAEGEQPEPAPHRRCADLGREIGDIKKALEVLNRRIHDGRQRASATVCDLVAPEHTRRVRAICDALKALDAALGGYAAFAAAMNAANVAWSTLRPLSVAEFGRPSTRGSAIGAVLVRAYRSGHLPESELPDWARV